MIVDDYGRLIYSESDICDLMMQGRELRNLRNMIVDRSIDLESMALNLEDPSALLTWTVNNSSTNVSVTEFDKDSQSRWYMPEKYINLDIAEYVLSLCESDAELQRCGEELLLFQEHNLFDLLKYLAYLVDTMKENRVIWGVGRGSSVASYVLYKLGVHKIDSLFYDLDPREFLR